MNILGINRGNSNNIYSLRTNIKLSFYSNIDKQIEDDYLVRYTT